MFTGWICSGLLRDDLYNEDDADVLEALRRLPDKEKYLRLFRIKRALDLSLKHSILPKEQWTTAEQVRVCMTSRPSLCSGSSVSQMFFSPLKGCGLSETVHREGES